MRQHSLSGARRRHRDTLHATVLTADMLAPGMHINAVGGDCPGKTELAADVLMAARVLVE